MEKIYNVISMFTREEGKTVISCEYCGHPIMNVVLVEDQFGGRMHIGVDCAEALNANGGQFKAAKIVNERQREKRQAKAWAQKNLSAHEELGLLAKDRQPGIASGSRTATAPSEYRSPVSYRHPK